MSAIDVIVIAIVDVATGGHDYVYGRDTSHIDQAGARGLRGEGE